MATIDFRDILKKLPKKEQQAIEARAQVLIKEEMNLQELRKAQSLTQHELAMKLGVKQAEISRLENREDILLSSLNSWVEAMGGTLEITAKIGKEKIILIPSRSGISKRVRPTTLAKKSRSKAVRSKSAAHRIQKV